MEEELADVLMAEVEARIKKLFKRNGKREDTGEVAIQFASLDELNGLIERLRGCAADGSSATMPAPQRGCAQAAAGVTLSTRANQADNTA